MATECSYGFLFNCMMVGHDSDSITILTYNFRRRVGACCLSLEMIAFTFDLFSKALPIFIFY